uniref:Secreted protein n=1 Tax=Achlya hypogyna TaxID=1202772 RepID=A0A0A7CP00_ACHHY|nr:secreted protein [Achlya hypogyna]
MMHRLGIVASLVLAVAGAGHVYFEVPYGFCRYVLEPVLVDENSVHLLVAQVEVVDGGQTDRIVEFDVVASDRLVATDGVAISTSTFDEIADELPGAAFVVPLLATTDDDDNQRLEGFLRLEVMAPKIFTIDRRLKGGDIEDLFASDCFEDTACVVTGVFDRARKAVVLRVASVTTQPSFNGTLARSVHPDDEIAAVNGVIVSLDPLDEVVEVLMTPGAPPVAVPLVDFHQGQGNVLSGFLRLERMQPSYLVFEPTLPARRQALHGLVALDDAIAAYEDQPPPSPTHRYVLDTALDSTAPLALPARPATVIYSAETPFEHASADTSTSDSTGAHVSDAGDHDSDAVDASTSDAVGAFASDSTDAHDMDVTDNRASDVGDASTRDSTDAPTSDVGGASTGNIPENPVSIASEKPASEDNGTSTIAHVSASGATDVHIGDAIADPVSDTDDTTTEATTEKETTVGGDEGAHARWREEGRGFEYSVTFAVEARLGINWELQETVRTVVASVEAHSPAAATQRIFPRDHLLALGPVNVSALGPAVAGAGAADHTAPRAAHNVAAARAAGGGFWYQIEFNASRAPVGLYWDLAQPTTAVVAAIDPNSAADALGVVRTGDCLELINAEPAAALSPREASAAFARATAPRRLVLFVPESPVAVEAEAEEPTEVALDAVVEVDPVQVHWATVSLAAVARHRRRGEAVRYVVTVRTPKPIGVAWNMAEPARAVVQAVEAGSVVANLSVVAAGDVLVGIGLTNVSGASLADVIKRYAASPLPRQLVFVTPSSSPVADDEAPATSTPLQHALEFQDTLLRNWTVPLAVAAWSTVADALGPVAVVVSDPAAACSPLKQSLPPAPVLVLAYRGVCSFPDKAQRVLDAGGSGLLLVNNAPGAARFPALPSEPPTSPIPVALVAQEDGDLLLALLRQRPAANAALWVRTPVTPPPPSTPLQPRSVLVAHGVGGSLRALAVQRVSSSTPIYHATAAPHQAVLTFPLQTGCFRDDLAVRGNGAVVVVKLGRCPIAQKAMTVQAMGAKGMLVVNPAAAPIEMELPPDVKIWILAIGADDAVWLEGVFEASYAGPHTPTFLRFSEDEVRTTSSLT